MKLSISNIAWLPEQDEQVFGWMKRYGYQGLEIAPTRILPDAPYDRTEEAAQWAKQLKETYGFSIPSMQSIWFGRTERLFGSEQEQETLKEYTKKAIRFAAAVHCGNLVFGCPRNRALLEGQDTKTTAAAAKAFFYEIGEYARHCGTTIGMEANPPIYHTNYINDTQAALRLLKETDSAGFCLNLDVGTMVSNQEEVAILKKKVHKISHVHISEPYLAPLKVRMLHRDLAACLREEGYAGYVSIEMGRQEDLSALEEAMEYIKEIFG